MNPPQIENYRITEILGKDATGTTWVAYNDQGEAVALKVLNRGAINFQLLETGLSRQLAHRPHPRVAELLDYDFTIDTPYLVTPLFAERIEKDNGDSYWEPCTLSSIEASLAPIEAWRYIYQIADALAHLHRLRAPHMGLRFDRVLLDDGDSPNIALSGCGEGIVGGLKSLDPGDFIPYAPPEQLRTPELYRERRAERWDVYAFGVIAYRLLTSSLPRGGTFVEELEKRRTENTGESVPIDLPQCATMIESEEEITWPSPAEDGTDERRRRVIEACLSIDSEARYIDMREVREVFCGLEDQLAHTADLESANTLAQAAKKKTRGARRLAAAFAFLATILGAGAAYQYYQQSQQGDKAPLAQQAVPDGEETVQSKGIAKPAPESVGAAVSGAPPKKAPFLEKFQRSSESVDSVFELIATRDSDGNLAIDVPDGVLGAILSYYQAFTQENEDDEALKLEVARARSIGGELLLGLGDPKEAALELEAAILMFAALRKEEPEDLSHLSHLAFATRSLAEAQRMDGRLSSAIASAQKAHGHFLELARKDSESSQTTRSLAQSKLFLARLLHEDNRSAEGAIQLDGARKLYERLAETEQVSGDDIASVARIDFIEADLEKDLGNLDEAIQLHIRSVDDLLPLTAKEPEVRRYQYQLAQSYGALADLVADKGDASAAVEANTQALGILAELTMLAPGHAAYRSDLALRFEAQATLERDASNAAEALESQAKAVLLFEDLVKDLPNGHIHRHRLAWAKSRHADLLAESKKLEEAVTAAGDSVREMQYLLINDLDPENSNAKRAVHRRDLARLYEGLAERWRAQKKPEDAAKCLEKALQQWTSLAASGGSNDKEVAEALATAKAELEKLQGS